MAFTPKQLRKHREMLRMLGVCVSCHRAPVEGRAVCRDCTDRINRCRAVRRQNARAEGKCYTCLRPLLDPAYPKCHKCDDPETRLMQTIRRGE